MKKREAYRICHVICFRTYNHQVCWRACVTIDETVERVTVFVTVDTVLKYGTVFVVDGVGSVVVFPVIPRQEQALEYRTEPEHGDA